MINYTLSMCREKLRTSGVELEIIPFDENLLAHGNEIQLSQVLLNLIHNSYDAILPNEKKWIHIEVHQDQQATEIHVIDSGPPISEQIQQKIFQVFH